MLEIKNMEIAGNEDTRNHKKQCMVTAVNPGQDFIFFVPVNFFKGQINIWIFKHDGRKVASPMLIQ